MCGHEWAAGPDADATSGATTVDAVAACGVGHPLVHTRAQVASTSQPGLMTRGRPYGVLMTNNNDAQTLAWLDQQDRMVTQTVRRHGWVVQYVLGEGRRPSFAYTVGLFGLGHPELVVFGLDYQSAMGLLNTVGERVRKNEDIREGQVLSFDGTDTRVRAEMLPNPGELVFAANRFYQRPDDASVPAFQLTWDVGGAFPGERGYSKPAWLQPKPGEFRA